MSFAPFFQSVSQIQGLPKQRFEGIFRAGAMNVNGARYSVSKSANGSIAVMFQPSAQSSSEDIAHHNEQAYYWKNVLENKNLELSFVNQKSFAVTKKLLRYNVA